MRRDVAQRAGDVSGTVPGTLSLSIGAAASLGAFTPGVGKDYVTTLAANVISTAGEATLSVADPSPTATGRLVNGAFALPRALQTERGRRRAPAGPYAPLSAAGTPLTLLSYGGPVSNDAVTIGVKQPIGATDALRTGVYSKTLVFTLSTTTP